MLKKVSKRRNVGWLELASLPLLLAIWHVLAVVVQHRLFPTPVTVFAELAELALTGSLISDLIITLVRAMWAFVVAMSVGILLGLLLGRFRNVDQLFGPWVVVGLNIPAIVVAITCYIWLGLTEVALILAVVINKTPLVITALREGMRNLSVDFDELARVYRFSRRNYVTRILAPQLMPYVLTAARTGLSLIWKIVLVFEVLGSDGGVGFRIGVLFQFFDIAGILAYTVAFIMVVLVFEYGIMRPLERRILGWRMART